MSFWGLVILKSVGLIGVFALTAVGLLLPPMIRKINNSSGILSLANCFSGGVFLGAGFCHMLPDAIDGFGDTFGDSVNGFPVVELISGLVIIGFLVIDNVIFCGHGHSMTLVPDGDHNHSHSHGHSDSKGDNSSSGKTKASLEDRSYAGSEKVVGHNDRAGDTSKMPLVPSASTELSPARNSTDDDKAGPEMPKIEEEDEKIETVAVPLHDYSETESSSPNSATQMFSSAADSVSVDVDGFAVNFEDEETDGHSGLGMARHHHHHDGSGHDSENHPHHAGGTGGSKYAVAVMLAVILSIHSFITGMAFGIQEEVGEAVVLLITLVAHKGIEAFALSTNIVKNDVGFWLFSCFCVPYSVMTPIGIFVGMLISSFLSGNFAVLVTSLFTAMASGTFLYVGLIECVAEELHHAGESRLWLCAMCTAIAIGYALFALLAIWA